MAVQYGTTYQQVIGAVADYYGAGSDQWYEIARHGIHSSQAESIISQVPYTNVIKNNAGQITGFTYDQAMAMSDGGVVGAIDSNLQLPTQANGNTFMGSIPASGSVDSQTGNINLSSGAKRVSDNATIPSVLTTVTAAVGGLSFGLKTGKNILNRIYQSDPEYWDNTFPTINPQTWDSIATTKLGKQAINAIFGIDKTTGQTQMYMPEEAFAYYAYAMAQEGFFGSGDEEVTQGDEWSQSQSWYSSVSKPIPFTNTYVHRHNHEQARYAFTTTYSGDIRAFGVLNGTNLTIYIFAVSGNLHYSTVYDNGQTSSGTTNIYSQGTVNGRTVRGLFESYTLSASDQISGLPSYTISGGSTAQIGYVLLYGTVSSTGHDGVTTQDGATVPDTSSWNDIPSTDQSLRQQYPDAYTNAIYTDVPQPDGTTTRIKYIPVPTTPTTGSEDEQPTNDDDVKQNQEVVTTDSIESLLKTIVRYIMQTQTETPTETPTPPDTPNPTDTGDGNTPPVVPPTGQASSLFAIYNPTQAQLNSFGAWLWSANFVDQILKLFNDPMQSIIGLHKIFASPSISGSSTIHVGYLDSGVSSNTVGAQYTDVNCGSVKVSEQFGNVFDYTDTNVRLYLPFIGIVDLDTGDVMRSTISVIYHVDVITGACLAEVKVSRDSAGGTLYQYAGDAAVRYPISSGSYMGVVSGVLSAVGGIASAFMTGGATLPMAAGAIAGGVSQAKTQVQHSGNFSGCAGAMGAKKPYLIIERPQTMIADDFESYQGKGANVRRTVGQMSGYFKFSDVHTDSIAGAAESEIEAIRAALESGVIA